VLDGILSQAAIQSLAKMSYYLIDVGTIATALAFVLLVAHTTMLATGRRVAAAAGSTVVSGTSASVALAFEGRSVVSQFVGRLSGLGEGTAAGAVGQAFAWASLLSVGLGMLMRALIVGRGPWGSLYEFSVAFAFGITLAYLVAGRRFPIRSIAFLPLGVAFFLLGYAFTLPQAISPLVPALDNPPLLTIHVAMAMLSYGIFAVSFGAAVAYLVQGRDNRVAWLPPAKVLDEVAYRAVIVGFPIFATLIILGSYWASIAWGRYWGWDPKETSALVTWLIYAAYLHMRTQRGWAGRPSALILVVGFAAVLVTYLGGNLFFGGLHTYSGL
jgi:cytochrome c-type biogenesis protein CcsB